MLKCFFIVILHSNLRQTMQGSTDMVRDFCALEEICGYHHLIYWIRASHLGEKMVLTDPQDLGNLISTLDAPFRAFASDSDWFDGKNSIACSTILPLKTTQHKSTEFVGHRWFPSSCTALWFKLWTETLTQMCSTSKVCNFGIKYNGSVVIQGMGKRKKTN